MTRSAWTHEQNLVSAACGLGPISEPLYQALLAEGLAQQLNACLDHPTSSPARG